MIYDYLAAKSQEARPSIDRLQAQEQAAQRALARQEREALYHLKEPALVHQLLEATTRSTSATEFRTHWQENELKKVDCLASLNRELRSFYERNFLAPTVNLTLLPPYSFLLQFHFVLEQPYLSKDDQNFHIIDNPVRKDRVFGLPYVPPSSWKGSLRAALWQLGYRQDTKEVYRLFGNPKEKETEGLDEFRAGRLHFFPTFFTEKSLEIINPHDRTRKVGKNPILFESVPIDAEGIFTLLYVPFDRVGEEKKQTCMQLSEDLCIVGKGLHTLFRVYGFGAKTSTGFGTAREKLKDNFLFQCNAEKIPPVPTAPKPQRRTQPKPAARSFSELKSLRTHNEGEPEGRIGFHEMQAYLERVSAALKHAAERQA